MKRIETSPSERDDPAMMIRATFPNASVAEEVGRRLVAEKHAACVNIFPGVYSIYEWEGKIERQAEAVMWAKTTYSRVADAAKRVVELHPYDEPSVLIVSVEGGATSFLDWIENATRRDEK